MLVPHCKFKTIYSESIFLPKLILKLKVGKVSSSWYITSNFLHFASFFVNKRYAYTKNLHLLTAMISVLTIYIKLYHINLTLSGILKNKKIYVDIFLYFNYVNLILNSLYNPPVLSFLAILFVNKLNNHWSVYLLLYSLSCKKFNNQTQITSINELCMCNIYKYMFFFIKQSHLYDACIYIVIKTPI